MSTKKPSDCSFNPMMTWWISMKRANKGFTTKSQGSSSITSSGMTSTALWLLPKGWSSTKRTFILLPFAIFGIKLELSWPPSEPQNDYFYNITPTRHSPAFPLWASEGFSKECWRKKIYICRKTGTSQLELSQQGCKSRKTVNPCIFVLF